MCFVFGLILKSLLPLLFVVSGPAIQGKPVLRVLILMAIEVLHLDAARDNAVHEVLFEKIANDLLEKGYSITPTGLPLELVNAIQTDIAQLGHTEFNPAAIGRHDDTSLNKFVRTDSICWIEGEMPGCAAWNAWMEELKLYLNRRLYLGLFAFESHVAQYQPGNFYKRHVDAFKGGNNRVLSVVSYFNSGWNPDDGGELVLYKDDEDMVGIKVTPAAGTLVIFLSEEFPHEVLPANRTRHSIAGWFRQNPGSDHLLELPDSAGSPI